MPSTYLLVYHGSRDPRPQAAVEQLVGLLCQKVRFAGNVPVLVTLETGIPSLQKPLVGAACLELAPLPLHEQIQQFGKQAIACGYEQLQILPLFLLPGVHVMEDIPAEVAIAQQALGSNFKIDIRPHLGSHPNLGHLLGQTATEADAQILLSHGSRRAGGNQSVETLASNLGAIPAYWSVQPSLESRLQELVSVGYQSIEILPYFLFPGGITDAIARSVAQYKEKFSSVNLHLAHPLGVSAKLVDLIWDLFDREMNLTSF